VPTAVVITDYQMCSEAFGAGGGDMGLGAETCGVSSLNHLLGNALVSLHLAGTLLWKGLKSA